MSLPYKIQAYIEQHRLLKPGEHVLVGVSGGADSMVLLHILQQLGFACSVAHMNFQLRGEASSQEADFVEAYAKAHGLPFYVKCVDTKAMAKEQGISIEMAARDLRYAFFSDVLKKGPAVNVAVGHHKNDLVETQLLNMARGTGVRGLVGIKPQNGVVIRPMLSASRSEIMEFADAHHLPYCTDASNADTQIKRNFIRHKVLPLMENLNPSFLHTSYQNALRMQQVQQLIESSLAAFVQKHVQASAKSTEISLAGLLACPTADLFLFELLHPFGFNERQLGEMLLALDSIPGKQWHANGHRVVRTHTHFIVQPWPPQALQEEQWFYREGEEHTSPIHLRIGKMQQKKDVTFNFDVNRAYVDGDKITFPLQLRKWEKGDWFVPLGMKGRKKLSDFFIDLKLSLPEKEAMYVLMSGNAIIWIPGYRTDERYKIDDTTAKVLCIEYHPA